MKKIYFVAIALAIILAVFLIATVLYGGTTVVLKNGLKGDEGLKPTFNEAYSYVSFFGQSVYCKNIGHSKLENAILKNHTSKSESFAIDYAHIQIEAGILKGTKYIDEYNQYVKWQSESKDLSVANWVKTWSLIEFEPKDPKY